MEDGMTTTCEIVQEMVFDHTWLNAEERQMLLAHLERCDDCRRMHDMVCEFGTLLYESAQSDMPTDMADRIMVAVATEAPEEARGLDLAIVLTLCAQTALLIGLKTDVWSRLRNIRIGWQWLIADVAQPMVAGCWAALSGTLGTVSGTARTLPVSDLWLPVAVGVLLLCVMSGGIIYHEEKYHD